MEKPKFQTLTFLLFLALFILISGCRQEPNFSGWVVDEKGQAISGASISINGSTGVSEKNGRFEMAISKADNYLLGISHPDFAGLFYASRSTIKDQVWTLAKAQISMHDPTNPISLLDERPELDGKGLEGAELKLPPNTLVDSQGNLPTGQVRAAIATLDLSNSEGPMDWGVRDVNGQEGFLVSYGAVYIQFSDPTGSTVYQIKNGMSGQLSLPVLPSMAAHTGNAPNPPFWYFDEDDGSWYEAGQSVYDPVTGTYKGNINHLSYINTDIAKTDAACLAVSKDTSIPNGYKLRIRYHSGGTAFGQVPVLVMNDPLNAVYRLPANTNVLLELLTPGDQVLGNLVVEDPAGNPLVSTVINTGPPLPSGSSLWPPHPYTPCKAITVKIETPQVEIRINESLAVPLPRDNPTDDYLTWAPTMALARLSTPMASNVNIVLTNDNPNIGGNVRFAAHTSPWPANTTATSSTLALTLPAGGGWVPFVIAGEFNAPSTNDKDAIVEAHQNNATGPVIGTKALMVRVRKNANNLQPGERDRLLFAWQKFRNRTSGANYILMAELHRLASGTGDEAHMQPAFLTWHRAFLLLVERELQQIDPSVALHYWDWDAAAPNIFSADFIGAPGNDPTPFVDIAEPVFSPTNPLLGWDTDLPFSGGEIRRNENNHTLDPGSTMRPLDERPLNRSLIDSTDYGPTTSLWFTVESFSDDVEKESHNPGHGWPCAGGHLTNPNRSASEPLFFLLHSQIDRQWAYWQRRYNRFGTPGVGGLTFPSPEHYDNNDNWNTPANAGLLDPNHHQKGSFLDDGLWPWDGTSGLPTGIVDLVQERPPNSGVGVPPADDTPHSTPTIPSTGFPASPHANLWPPAVIIPQNRHMIDYLGKFRPQDGLGFCYEDVSY